MGYTVEFTDSSPLERRSLPDRREGPGRRECHTAVDPRDRAVERRLADRRKGERRREK